jgi:hypothetical protein
VKFNFVWIVIFLLGQVSFAQTVMFQNSSEIIWSGNSESCVTSGPGTIEDNRFMRVFDTDDYSIQDTAFFVYLEFAVESTSGGSYELVGRVHQLNDLLLLSNMDLLAADTISIYPDSSLYRMQLFFKDGYALPGDTLVAELFAPLNPSVFFLPGSNPYLESGLSYIVAPACGLWEPTAFDDISFPEIKLILKLAVNQKPFLSGLNVTVFKNGNYTFKKSEFVSGFSDYDSDTLHALRIVELPLHGTLTLDGIPLIIMDTIDVDEILNLAYTPNTDYVGLDSFSIQAGDAYHWSWDSSFVSLDVINWQLGLIEKSGHSIRLSPNPANDFLIVHIEEPINAHHVYNSLGQLMNVPRRGNELDVSNLPAGNYWVKLQFENRQVTQPFIKE